MTILTGKADDIPLYIKRVAVFVTLLSTVFFGGFSTHPLFAEDSVKTAHAPADHVPTEEELREMLWLARALYSETKLRAEQEVIAWVIRNRVESLKYPDTYEAVVLQKGQFSGLHSTDKQYAINISREYTDVGKGWDSAVEVAQKVYFADSTERPILETITHFYSPTAVSRIPNWAAGEPAHVIRDDMRGYTRFAFYANVK